MRRYMQCYEEVLAVLWGGTGRTMRRQYYEEVPAVL